MIQNFQFSLTLLRYWSPPVKVKAMVMAKVGHDCLAMAGNWPALARQFPAVIGLKLGPAMPGGRPLLSLGQPSLIWPMESYLPTSFWQLLFLAFALCLFFFVAFGRFCFLAGSLIFVFFCVFVYRFWLFFSVVFVCFWIDFDRFWIGFGMFSIGFW